MPVLPAQLMTHCAPHVAHSTLAAIVLTESRGNPLAIGVNGHRKLDRQPATLAQAVHWAQWLYAHGYNFDAGLMQVNVKNFAKTGVTPETVFDPCTNLRAGAQILRASYTLASSRFGHSGYALSAAISAYNTGNFEAGFRNGYVGRVFRSGHSLAGAAVPPPEATDERRRVPHARRADPLPPNPYQAPASVASFASDSEQAVTWSDPTSTTATTGAALTALRGKNP